MEASNQRCEEASHQGDMFASPSPAQRMNDLPNCGCQIISCDSRNRVDLRRMSPVLHEAIAAEEGHIAGFYRHMAGQSRLY
jgi:hypothetical protein